MKRDKQELFTRAKWMAKQACNQNVYMCVLPLNVLYHFFFTFTDTNAYTRKFKQNEWMWKKNIKVYTEQMRLQAPRLRNRQREYEQEKMRQIKPKYLCQPVKPTI